MIADSPPGEATGFLEKKEVNLLPGVWGFFASVTDNDFIEEVESVRKGGGLAPGLGAMSSSSIGAPKDIPFDVCDLWYATGWASEASNDVCDREPFVLVRVKLFSSVFLLLSTGAGI